MGASVGRIMNVAHPKQNLLGVKTSFNQDWQPADHKHVNTP